MKKPIQETPNTLDFLLLTCFIAFITYQPFLLYGEINFLETGIHLPAINALFHDAVPYRDFFYLRGPLELYVPYLMMTALGTNMAVLPLFYFIFTIMTLLFCCVIARYIYRSRFILYLMIPVLVARTFPRVAFSYWGGMRYALGILSLVCLLFLFKSQKRRYALFSGISVGLCLLTTIEAGFASSMAIGGALAFAWIFQIQNRDFLIKSFGLCLLGFFCIIVPYSIYALLIGSFFPFIESVFVVVSNMTNTFIEAKSSSPQNIKEFLLALFPFHHNFDTMTPVYCFILFFSYTLWRIKQKTLDWRMASLVGVFIYGLAIFITGFRKIEFQHFEMALQPVKILLFFMVEEAYFFLRELRVKSIELKSSLTVGKDKMRNSLKIIIVNFLFVAVVMSSVGYAVTRYDNHFVMFKWVKAKLHGAKLYDPVTLKGENPAQMNLKRMRGYVVPSWQAEEMEATVRFIQENTHPTDTVFTYPEFGSFNFLFDRPFIGKFPNATFSWMNKGWREEMFDELLFKRPNFIIMANLNERYSASQWYFRNPTNQVYFEQTTQWILKNYKLRKKFTTLSIYEHVNLRDR